MGGTRPLTADVCHSDALAIWTGRSESVTTLQTVRLRLVSWNVGKRESWTELASLDADVALLQEVKNPARHESLRADTGRCRSVVNSRILTTAVAYSDRATIRTRDLDPPPNDGPA